MKLDNLSDVYLAVSVLVPGFIHNGVLRKFVPIRQAKEHVDLILGFLTATAYNYAICSILIYLLLAGAFSNHILEAALWFCIIFIIPILLAVLRAEVIQHDRLGVVYHILRLRPISPIPTGWDWIFGRTSACFVLVTLSDGTEIAGFFGPNSMASSDPERRDIFLEKVYTIPDDGGAWVEVSSSLGMYVDGSQIAFIEFRG